MDSMNTTSDASNSSMPVVPMAMLPFHTAVGFDMLWFQSWMPMSPASTLGTCIGLFFLAIFYRFLFALRAVSDLKWAMANNNNQKEQTDECCPPQNTRPRFSPKVDVLRGLLEGLLSFIGYLLMLAVMVMNAWFFIAIILGITVGEITFGRYTSLGIEKHLSH